MMPHKVSVGEDFDFLSWKNPQSLEICAFCALQMMMIGKGNLTFENYFSLSAKQLHTITFPTKYPFNDTAIKPRPGTKK